MPQVSVSQAVESRSSTRAFSDQPIATQVLTDLLKKASRAPSGGNLQPWKICLLNGERMQDFRETMARRMQGEPYPGGEAPEYDVYPPKMIEPYRTARFEVGEEMYALLDIPRDDKAARAKWFAENYRFFGAPAAIFCFFDRMMGPPQWSDLGMFLQTFMLLLEESGIQSCAQECWYRFPKTVADFCDMEEEDQLFCGMAIGYADTDHPVNQLRSKRLDQALWLKVL